jgi:hypothetical protein
METSTVHLHLRKHGHVPSFKNKKMLTRGKLITNPKKQKQMDALILDLKYQLISLFRTSGTETQMALSQPCLTALSEHSTRFDDSVQWIPKITIHVKKVSKGFEGADIAITLIP